MTLNKKTKKFIIKKVKKLGSVESVKSFYNESCAVDDFANKTAKKLFNQNSNPKHSKIKRRTIKHDRKKSRKKR